MDKVSNPPARRRTDGKKFDFRLQFHASRVPNSGWDKLVVSLISVETGKTTVKTSRGHVRNGTCQWPDPVVESTRIVQDLSTGEYDEKVYRVLVQMGSLRVGILGETTMNLSEYIHADSPDTISLPLRNCSAGTVLHVKIQCLSPKVGSRDFEWQRGTSQDQEDLGSDSDGDGTGSEFSENLTVGSVISSASRSYLSNSHGQVKPMRSASPNRFKKGGRSSATSRYSSDSFESLTHGNAWSNGSGRHLSNMDAVSSSGSSNSISRRHYLAASRDASNGLENSRSSYAQNLTHQGEAGYPSKGLQDSYTQETETDQNSGLPPPDIGSRVTSGLPQRLEAAEATIQELRQESLTWERRSRKLRVEVETLKQQLANEVKSRAELGVEMSALKVERDNLKLEVEQLKAAKLASKQRENEEDYIRWEVEDSKRLVKALQEEINYEKEVNVDLRLQISKLQDSNAELVSAVAEVEETIEMRNSDIDRLQKTNCRLEDQLQSMSLGRLTETNENVLTFEAVDQSHDKSSLDDEKAQRREVVEQQQNVAAAETEFIRRLMEKDQEVKQLEAKIWNLEEEVKGLNTVDATWREKLSAMEMDYEQQLTGKCIKIEELALKLARLEDEFSATGVPPSLVKNNVAEDLIQTIETLKGQIEEQEIDFKELTNENVELHYKLGRANEELISKMERIAQLEASLDGLPSFKTTRSSEQLLGKQIAEKQVLIDDLKLQVDDLGKKNALLQDQLQESTMNFEGLPKKNGEYHRDLLHRQMEIRAVEDQDVLSSTSVSDRMEEMDADEPEGDLVEMSSQELQPKIWSAKSSSSDEKCTQCENKLSFLDDANANLQEQLQQVSMSKKKLEDELCNLLKQKEEIESKTSDLLSKRDGEIRKLQQESAIHIATKNRLEVEVAKHHSEVDKLIRELGEKVANEKKLEAQLIEAENQRDLSESKVQDLLEERGLTKSRIEELEFQLPILSEEIKLLNASKHEYESMALKLEMEKTAGQEKLDEAQEESRTARERLDELVGQMAALTTTLDSQLIAKRSLERRASELESDKEELETQVLDLEEENLQLTERISGLEAQLRCVTEERESYKLGMDNAQTQISDFQAEKKRSDAAFQEALGGYQQQLAELERHRAFFLQEAESYSQRNLNLEQELNQQKDEVSRLKHSHHELEKAVKDLQLGRSLLEHQLQEAVTECISIKANCETLEADVAHKQRESEQRELSFKEEIGALCSFRDDLQHRANKAEEELTQMQSEKVSVVNHLQNELQRLTEQLSSTFDEKEKLASQALVEASELRAEKMELKESLKHTQEKLRKMEEELAALQNKMEFKMGDMSSEMDASKKLNKDLEHKLQELNTLLEQTGTAAADDKRKIQKLEGLLQKSEHERQSLWEEQGLLNGRVSELIGTTSEMENLKDSLDQMSSQKLVMKSALENMRVQCESMHQEKIMICEKLTAFEGMAIELDELKQQKSALEEKLARFQSLLEAQEASKIQEAEQRNEFIRLKRHMSQVQRKLVDQERERIEFQSKVESLEEELSHKSHALSRTEKQLKASEVSRSGRSMDRSNSKIDLSSPSRESKQLIELRERLRSLEWDIRAKDEEIEKCKREFLEREIDLCNKIEHLELSNEQLAAGLNDTEVDQLKKELIRLQNQNSLLSRKEQELLSRMHTQEVLQGEVQRLQETNDLLEARLSKFMESAKNPYLLEKIVNLEIELQEAIEANNMYKLQLQSVFDKQQNVSMAALQNLGDLDQVVNDFFEYKKKATQLEDELRGMHERYSLMSLQLAEAEAERGELLRAVKSLKSSKKS